MSLQLSDITTDIENALQAAYAAKYIARGPIPIPVVQEPVNMGVGMATDADITAAANYAIYLKVSKWQTDDVQSRPLKISGADMVKRITGLEATESD
jgi:hypothetical protein